MWYDYSILGLRICVAAVLISSARLNLIQTTSRAEHLGLPPSFTIGLGIMYLICSLSLILGIYIHIASIVIISAMLVGFYKKIFIWKTGIWGKTGFGWHYNILFIFCNLVFIADSGRFIIVE